VSELDSPCLNNGLVGRVPPRCTNSSNSRPHLTRGPIVATRIVILDRDDSDRTGLVALLQAMGSQVVPFSAAPAALVYLTYARADLVLADPLGSEIAPVELIRLLGLRSPGLPLVALGRKSRIQHARYAELMTHFGADALLEKPIDETALRRVVHRLLPL
jgi:FixJ family two-component response regulator